ncbi:ImmA/IrrE family metallo-endopeptidase [Clostridium sp. KNHs214]|uniref:ImmA/IrrE family metallo-endopeptidase n=1 Tax=Clostridium sp. KNHs214 TaxID=1540257 RepID=UPI00068CF40F|nr:ImmA/IrrE family metallo-endopeptidase [Clostridium sp. KNHs214]
MDDMNIKIGTFNYDVSETNQPLLLNHAECAGIIDYENLTIQIKNESNTQRKKQTLLHELFHGIINEYNIDISNVDEEYLVETLGTAMYQIIKDNDKLIKYVREEV